MFLPQDPARPDDTLGGRARTSDSVPATGALDIFEYCRPEHATKTAKIPNEILIICLLLALFSSTFHYSQHSQHSRLSLHRFITATMGQCQSSSSSVAAAAAAELPSVPTCDAPTTKTIVEGRQSTAATRRCSLGSTSTRSTNSQPRRITTEEEKVIPETKLEHEISSPSSPAKTTTCDCQQDTSHGTNKKLSDSVRFTCRLHGACVTQRLLYFVCLHLPKVYVLLVWFGSHIPIHLNSTNLQAHRRHTLQYQSRRRKELEQQAASCKIHNSTTSSSPLCAAPALRLPGQRNRRHALVKENSWFHMAYLMDSFSDSSDHGSLVDKHEHDDDDDSSDPLGISSLSNSSWGELGTMVTRRASALSTKVTKNHSTEAALKDASRNTCSTQDMTVAGVDDANEEARRSRSVLRL